jgi:hypothetical protein
MCWLNFKVCQKCWIHAASMYVVDLFFEG